MTDLYLRLAMTALRCRDYDRKRRALLWLSEALGAAKSEGRSYAAGRILTAIQWVRKIS